MSHSRSFSFIESKMGGIPRNNSPPLLNNLQQQQHFKIESDYSSLMGHNFVQPTAIFDPTTTDINNISNLIASQHQDSSGNSFDYQYLQSNSSNHQINGDILQEAKFEALRTDEVASVEDGMIPFVFSSNGINLSGFDYSSAAQVNAISSGESASNYSDYDCSQTFPDQLLADNQQQARIQGPGGFLLSGTEEIHHGALEKLINNATMKTNFSQSLNIYGDDHFKVVSELDQSKPKKQKHSSEKTDRFFNFQQQPVSGSLISDGAQDAEAIAQMKEMIYREAAFRPVNFDVEVVEKPKRRNVKTSKDPQTVAARQRREKISEKIRVLQKMVPGGSQMDTASMLDEAANYLKFLRSFVKELEDLGGQSNQIENWGTNAANLACPSSMPMPMPSYLCLEKYPNVNHMRI